MRLLDLCCGGGGSAVGFSRAGFGEIVGVDIFPQPRYPFTFFQADALEFFAKHGHEFDLVNISPPCQWYGKTRPLYRGHAPKLIEPSRELLRKIGRPYVMENVPGSPLENPLMLCGTMFGLHVQRHRLFEIWPEPIWFPPASCNHWGKVMPSRIRNYQKYSFFSVVGHVTPTYIAGPAMGIDWMTRKELTQAVPPAYTEWIGIQILKLYRI